LRLSPKHTINISKLNQDKIIFVDVVILPLVNQLHEHLPTVKTYVVITDKDQLPENNLPNVYSYEELLKEGDETYPFSRDIDENDPAGMCYTSATTGKPKGVLYSHRAITLHSYALGLA